MNKRTLFTVFILLALIFVGSIFGMSGAQSAYAAETGSSAQSMALLEVSTGRILYEKNAHKRLPLASTTKILTAITVIENVQDLNKIQRIPDAAVGVEGSSIYLEKGEELSVLDLLYGLMLQSGNDCAEALAIITAKTLPDFAKLMNETARKIGATESNFVTPHGLHHSEHYTTAYDLALISAYALKNPVFAEIVKTQKHTTPWKGRDYSRVILNKNKLLASFDGCDGVKTGYTKKAGRCYVSSATRNGMQVVCAVLNCGPMFEECAAFMNRAFNEYSMVPVLSRMQKVTDAPVSESRVSNVAVGSISDIMYPLKKGEAVNIKLTAYIDKALRAPMDAGEEIGKIRVFLQNSLLFEEKLYTIEKAESKSVLDRLKELAKDWVS